MAIPNKNDGVLSMFYYSPSVKQCHNLKGKPWRAVVYYTDPITKLKRQKSKTLRGANGKREALKMAREWMDEINAIAEKNEFDKNEKTVESVILAYEEMRLSKGIQKSTYKRNLLITKNYITPYLGDYLFTSIDRNDIDDWVSKLFEKGYSPTTILNAFKQLKKVYTYYFDRDEIEINPFKGVKTPKGGGARKTHLTKEQMDAFLSAVMTEYETPQNAMYCGCMIACYAGLRRGEICALRWRNIDFQAQTITIDSAIGYGEGGGYTKDPKNESSKRTFPILPQLLEVLKERYDYLKPQSNWFVIGNEEKFMSLQSFTYSFQKLADKYGLVDYYGKRLTPHGLRHNIASIGIRSGMDIASLATMMGHASKAMTLDIYGDDDPDAMKTASEKLALRFDDESEIAVSDKTAEKLYEIEQKLKQDETAIQAEPKAKRKPNRNTNRQVKRKIKKRGI